MHNLRLATAFESFYSRNANLSKSPTLLPVGDVKNANSGQPLMWNNGAPYVERRNWSEFAKSLTQTDIDFDPALRTLWQFMVPKERPSFTADLIADITATLDFVESTWRRPAAEDDRAEFLVLGSRVPGIFNLGGDLPLFQRLIETGDEAALREYAYACVRGQYRLAVNLELPLCTIALVQGDALGGGFEAALAHSIIVAERSAKFALPEVLFNLFPGMGAYTFLARRLDPARAERMILSGRVFTADELSAMGVIDVVAEDGAGVEAVHDFIQQFRRSRRTRQSLLKVRQASNPVRRQELFRIADLWVENALSLDRADLRKMRHLAIAQDRRWSRIYAA
ncbi:MAG: enoyl-CoA hydratase [Rhodospirillales bacterium]|nr:MAG: enoyl-CoA hydratase [Rhodospirillales bacterium]